MSFDVRCHRCSKWIGEAHEPVELVGLFRDPQDRHNIPAPRQTFRCKSCMWTNVFRVVASAWRGVQTKAGVDIPGASK